LRDKALTGNPASDPFIFSLKGIKMKVKTFVACVLTASAMPLAPALALGPQPSDPQGTGWYGAPNAAVPVPQPEFPADSYAPALPQDGVSRGASADQGAYDRNMGRDVRRDDTRRPMRGRGMYDGPSWSTNPPAPPA
jgi:hypothetical protein